MKSRIVTALFCLGALAAVHHAAAGEQEPAPGEALAAIASLDVPRYMGTWYEIARYPNWFQKKCAGYAKAEYSLEPDGRVRVINSCRLDNGEISQVQGVARQLGGAASPKLEVSFAPAWLSFLPFVWGDYWVIDLDENYQLVAVSEPAREYLWVLSRTPQVDRTSYAELLGRLAGRGFDPARLIVTRQAD